jgi:predicted heme/steroid binding protein
VFDGTAWQKVDNTDSVTSVNGFTGAVTLTTTNISEGTNLYYLDSRARAAISLTTTGNSGAATYSNLTGVLNIPQYSIAGLGGVPDTRLLTINGTAYDLSANRTWSVGTVTSIATSGPITGGTITGSGTIGITQATISTNGYLSSTDWNTFNNKQNAITLTTTGNNGSATLVGATLNIPSYTLSGLGGVPDSRTLTINGTSYDLSVNRTWSVGTVTSITFTGPLTGGTITGSGTVGITQASGSASGYLSSTDWTTFNNKQNALTLTTSGTSGAATLVGATLNIPVYQSVLTNPVTGTGTAGYLSKFTGTSAIGNSLLYDNGSALAMGTTSINASALFQLDSTTKGFLPPRMTSAQRTAISTPAEGLVVFQTDAVIGLYIYANGTWRSLTMV